MSKHRKPLPASRGDTFATTAGPVHNAGVDPFTTLRVTKTHRDGTVDLTVDPPNGLGPFTRITLNPTQFVAL